MDFGVLQAAVQRQYKQRIKRKQDKNDVKRLKRNVKELLKEINRLEKALSSTSPYDEY